VGKLIIATLCFAFAPPVLAAQTPGSPEAAARAYFAARQSGDWAAAAALMDPQALERFKSVFVVVAEADTSGQMLHDLFSVRSAAEFARLHPAEVYVRVNRAMLLLSPELRASFAEMRAEVIGHVPESPDLAHVVYRLRTSPADSVTGRIEVVTFRRSNGGWRAQLTNEFDGLLRALGR
jgi:hypothetical protein